jgi:hypothetical protein
MLLVTVSQLGLRVTDAVATNKFRISISPERAADSLVEWLRKNIRAMAARSRYYDQTMPRLRRVSETELKEKYD